MKKGMAISRSLLAVAVMVTFMAVMYSGCSGGWYGSGSERTGSGALRLSVAWPGEPLPEEGAKYIPAGAKIIEVKIGEYGSGNYKITTNIVYPVSTITIENIPPGDWVATIKAFDETKSTLYSQRKQSFEIVDFETTESGNMPLGVAITGTTASPVFEPSVFNMHLGGDYVFQNWLEEDYNVSLDITGNTTQHFYLDGASPDSQFPGASYTVTLPQDARTATFSLDENPSVTGSGTVLYNAPLQPYWINVTDLIPKTTNGVNGVWCNYGTSGTLNLPWVSDYYFNNPSGYSYVFKVNPSQFVMRVGYYIYCGQDLSNSWLIIPLNAGFSKYRVTGEISKIVYSELHIFQNSDLIWTAPDDSEPFDLERIYTAGDVLKFHTHGINNFSGTTTAYYSNVKIIGIP